MSWRTSKLYSIIKVKCPRCHDGNMFPPKTLYSFSRFAKMYKNCPCCGQNFEPEPGFYFGAMFISYAFSAAIFLTVWLILISLVDDVSAGMFISTVLIVVLLLLPIIFRLSRAIWINIFIRYEGPCNQIKKK